MGEAKYIFLADDDGDDRYLFESALKEVSDNTSLAMANDGEELMIKLDKDVPPIPHVIFLDLNMPRKNGFECLEEIRAMDKFKNVPVVIFSTSVTNTYVDKGYEGGANYYIRKPSNFSKLKSLIEEVLAINFESNTAQPSRDQFILAF